MDFYHTPEIFARRILYKPPKWKEYFSTEKWINSTQDVLNNFNNKDDLTLPKIIHTEIELLKENFLPQSQKNIFDIPKEVPPCKIVTVKMFNTSPKRKSEMIYIEPKKDTESPISQISENGSNNQLTSTILESTQELNTNRNNCTPKSKNMSQKCIFQENADRPLSPIPSLDTPNKHHTPYKNSRKTIRSSFRERLQKTPSKSTVINYPENQKESEIIKNLVLDRFISNIEAQLKQNHGLYKRNSMRSYKSTTRNPFDYEFNNKIRKVRDIIAQYENCETGIRDTAAALKKTADKVIEYPESNENPQKEDPTISSGRTNDNNSEYNLADNEESNVDKKETIDTTKLSDFPSYDPNKFLEVALGDELYTTISETFSDVTLHLQDKLTLKQENSITEDFSICTGEASQLLTDRGTPSPFISFNTTDNNSLKVNYSYETTDVDTKIMDLMQQSIEQHSHILQATKALNLCHSSKKYINRNVEIEAERLLLIAELKNRAILDEIERLDKGETNDTNQLGTVTISNLRVPLSFALMDPLQRKINEMKQFFICVFSSGSQVMSTNVVSISYGDTIIFNEAVTFKNLTPDFVINLNIYCFEQPKFYHSTDETICPSPKSFFKKHICKTFFHSRQHFLTNNIRSSSFKLIGTTKLELRSLNQSNPFQLENIHYYYLKGEIYLYIEKSVRILINHQGFLTIGSEAGGYPSWSRYWCVLEDHLLKYWNYPAEMEIKDPIGVINLKNCISSWIDKVNSKICSRPRTILLETARDKKQNDRNSIILECKENYTVIRHLLACDSDKDMKEWCKNLNNVVSYLRNWNII